MTNTQKPPTWRGEVFTWANLFTTVRVFCVAGIFAYADDSKIVFVLALIGAISDAADGYLARLRGPTKFGARYDQYTDWGFAIAIIYAIVRVEGYTFYNLPLILLIGGYLVVRALFLNVDTNGDAKKKTIVQMTGVVVILAGHAFEVTLFVVFGYVLLWISLWYMVKALRNYSHHV